MKTVHMLIGIPGCGKTTFANKLKMEKQLLVISTDVVRANHPDFTEDQVWPEVYRLVGEVLNNNDDLIFDATNITPKVRDRFKCQVNPYCSDYKMIAYYFDVDWHICYNRVQIRNKDPLEHHLPTDVIEGYGEKIIKPTLDEGFIKIFYIDENGTIIKKEEVNDE